MEMYVQQTNPWLVDGDMVDFESLPDYIKDWAKENEYMNEDGLAIEMDDLFNNWVGDHHPVLLNNWSIGPDEEDSMRTEHRVLKGFFYNPDNVDFDEA